MTDPSPLLLLDIGNTNTKIGLVLGGTLDGTYVVPTRHRDTADTWGFHVLEICRLRGVEPRHINSWVVSSVVPPVDAQIRMAGRKYCDSPVVFVPRDLPLPLENRYSRPDEVGADRLVTAFAARRMFEAPAIVVVDFGTATTLDCVQGNAYLGGLICPGVLSSARALGTLTAKLPQVSLELDRHELEIGLSTATSLNNGFIFGFAAMIEGLCRRVGQKLDERPLVVATGGFSQTIHPVCPCIDQVRPDLLLQGLLMAHAGHAAR